ncbi:hypothetical protein ENHY17A_50431 [Moraxellaceae bacterium 17A]|nr:hypothetical protein ENHY17A_50431 [Moraxellaceae bacterium 17A]
MYDENIYMAEYYYNNGCNTVAAIRMSNHKYLIDFKNKSQGEIDRENLPYTMGYKVRWVTGHYKKQTWMTEEHFNNNFIEGKVKPNAWNNYQTEEGV